MMPLMKKLVAAGLVVAFAGFAWRSLPSPDQAQSPGVAQATVRGSGVVQDVDLQTGTVTIRHGQAVAHIWDQLPSVSRESYGVAPAPGKPIAAALDYVKSPDPAAFAVLDCTISSIDVLHLGSVHRRASFDRTQGWHGQWLVP